MYQWHFCSFIRFNTIWLRRPRKLLVNSPTSRYFPYVLLLSKHTLAIKYHVYISAAVTPVKYECDSWNLTGTFARSKILITERLMNKSLEPPPLGITRKTRCGVTQAPFANFSVSKIFDLAKVSISSFDHIHIWQVSPQLSCGDTCQI